MLSPKEGHMIMDGKAEALQKSEREKKGRGKDPEKRTIQTSRGGNLQ